MLIKPIVLALIFGLSALALQAQNRLVYGIISDAGSGEALPMATVSVLETGAGVVTNAYGHYQLAVAAGDPLTFVYQFVGYRADTAKLVLVADTLVNVALWVADLGEVEVVAVRGRADLGSLRLPVSRLVSVPVLLGEADLFKSLAMLPGIATGVEGSSGLYVRGGSPDQNLVLLDGSTVYNTSHLFGFLSAFQPSAVKDIEVIKGGFPARYGGRLSSVINVTMKDGDRKAKRRENSFGLVASSLLREGPLRGGKGAYLVAGRLAQVGVLTLLTLPSYYAGDPLLLAGMYDLNAKLSFDLADGGRLYLSAYAGDDIWGNMTKSSSGREATFLSWGNRTVSARHTKSYSPSLFGQGMLNFNDFSYRATIKSTSTKEGERAIRVASRIRELTARQWFTWSAAPAHTLHFGLEASLPWFAPSSARLFQDGKPVEGFSGGSAEVRAFSGALFLEEEWALPYSWQLSAGVRWAMYRVLGNTFHGPEPRVSLSYLAQGGHRWQLGYSRMVQPVHLISPSGTGLSNDLWLPATPKVPPQAADQANLGWSRDFGGFSASSEIFYKYLTNQSELVQGGNFFFNGSSGWENAVATGGTGRAYGWEVLLNKYRGRLTGWLAYTLSRNERQFDSINRGQRYPFKYDRRHDLSVTASYKVSPRLRLASGFVFQTGHAITLPEAIHQVMSPNGEVRGRLVYGTRNNRRMPNYHRLDFSASYDCTTAKGKAATLSAGVYNLYGQPNLLYIDSEGDPVRFRQVTLFRFIPSLNYTVKW